MEAYCRIWKVGMGFIALAVLVFAVLVGWSPNLHDEAPVADTGRAAYPHWLQVRPDWFQVRRRSGDVALLGEHGGFLPVLHGRLSSAEVVCRSCEFV
jgi:hypothetical protein